MTQAFIETSLRAAHISWQPILRSALQAMDPDYLRHLAHSTWLPGPSALLNAFSLPLAQTRFVLYGESPYPRAQSANGYAFWDADVTALWSERGLSTAVNRATSLRNFIKMLLVADGALQPTDCGHAAIAQLDKHAYHTSLTAVFAHMIDQGFLLLNASLALSARAKVIEARYWHVFHQTLLSALQPARPQLLLFGKIADQLQRVTPLITFPHLIAEHPYNLSFIQNPRVLEFFRPLQLLHSQAR